MRIIAVSVCLAWWLASMPLVAKAQLAPMDEATRTRVVQAVQRIAAAINPEVTARMPALSPTLPSVPRAEYVVPDLPAGWLNGTTMGDPDAPVTVQVWEDFLCPACGEWSATIEPQVIKEYVEPGLVKLEIHHFPLSIHAPGAEVGAQASLCANDQDEFWRYRQRLFAAQEDGQAGFTFDALASNAEELGLDSAAFRDCLERETHREDVLASVDAALGLGLTFVTSIVVNGERMADSFGYDTEMKPLIEAALAAGE